MSEHGREERKGGAAAASGPIGIPDVIDLNPARWVKQADNRHRWWNGENWTDYYTMYPNDGAAVQRAMMSLPNPPKWVKQDDGRLRWWAGENWSDSWKDDPDAVVAAPIPVAAESPAVSAADEIKKLAELHAAGVLDDEEFAAAKKKALGL